MTDHSGWLDSRDVAAAELAARAAEAQHSRPDAAVAPGPGALLVAGPRAQVAQDPARGMAAMLCGHPRWLDPELAATANRRGDAHALLDAYATLGERLVERLGGTFALTVVDAPRKRALLAIDRMGVERLCYGLKDGLLAFGATVDDVTRHASIGFSIEPQAIFDYLYHHMIPAPRTIARGVYKLPGAHLVTFSAGQATLRRYWHCQFANGRDRFDEPARALELLHGLETITAEQRNGADSAAFLSGGIDSSTVAGMLARASPGEARTYTIGFAAPGYDEVNYARITTKHFRLRGHEYYVTPQDVASGVPKLATAFDEPFGNSSAIPAYFCALAARQDGVRQLLAGDGGDELFGGNTRYAKQNVFEWYLRVPRGVRAGMVEPFATALGSWPLVRKLRSYIEQANVPLPDRLQTYNYIARESSAAILHEQLASAVDTQLPLAEQRAVFAEPGTDDKVNRMLYLDWKYTLADNDLRKVMSSCALAGIDVRFPWLDERIVDLSLRVPGTAKVRGRTLRYFVKRALADFLPRQVIHKPKHGFGLPFGVWMREDRSLQHLVGQSMASLKERRLVRADYIESLMRRHREEHAAYYGEFLWVLMMLELWLQGRSVRGSFHGSALQ
jgi:asparagine synthase (glutamine-hydrolysing)